VEWRKLHNEELSDLYCSPNIVRVNKSRRMRQAGHVARVGRGEMYMGFWWRERDLGRTRRRCKDNIKMDLQEVGRGGMDWIDLVQEKDGWRELANGSTNYGEFLD
jgi:hypothetical protein